MNYYGKLETVVDCMVGEFESRSGAPVSSED